MLAMRIIFYFFPACNHGFDMSEYSVPGGHVDVDNDEGDENIRPDGMESGDPIQNEDGEVEVRKVLIEKAVSPHFYA